MSDRVYKCHDSKKRYQPLMYRHPLAKVGNIYPGSKFKITHAAQGPDKKVETSDNWEVDRWDKAVLHNYPIWSLRRLSDGAEFTVGDKVEAFGLPVGIIKEFVERRNRILVLAGRTSEFLKDIHHPQIKPKTYNPTFEEICKVMGRTRKGPYGRALKKLMRIP